SLNDQISLIPPIPKSERKVDGPRKRRKVLTIRPTKESRPEQVLPTGKKGRSSLVSVPLKKKEAHPGHVPQPPSATKGKVSHATKPTTKQEAPEVKVSPHINSVTPSNLREEKMKFFKSQFTYNPQFQYSTPDPPSVPPEYRTASGEFLDLAIAIIEKTLKRYGSYERFQDNAGGRPLQEHEIATAVQRHLQKEGCSGEMKVCITKDTLCIASMAIVNGRGMLTINASTARERWLEGTLCHEIGTHYYRSMNNMKQPWWQERKKYGMRPVNPTEEGFATLNTVLLRDQPYLCRAALLYYAAYKASSLSFSELFKDLSAYVKDPDTLWYICMKVKSGLTDTSQPGCNSKCQVYLQGVLQLLRYRQTIDFQLLMALGKISFEDVGRLKRIAVSKGARMPYFLRDKREYMRRLEHIMKVNGITDDALKKLIDS
uniref:KIAA0895 n=1 Tax=Leptobrachium leishanense TaxID=445787 RepID=A0A8C5QLC9_9ANUR